MIRKCLSIGIGAEQEARIMYSMNGNVVMQNGMYWTIMIFFLAEDLDKTITASSNRRELSGQVD